jgi:hypothetical protein
MFCLVLFVFCWYSQDEITEIYQTMRMGLADNDDETDQGANEGSACGAADEAGDAAQGGEDQGQGGQPEASASAGGKGRRSAASRDTGEQCALHVVCAYPTALVDCKTLMLGVDPTCIARMDVCMRKNCR